MISDEEHFKIKLKSIQPPKRWINGVHCVCYYLACGVGVEVGGRGHG